ncbi:MAG: hypothetical protein FJ241_11250 [Nitrospira sp.]|nr:hypothetical protein [Nitrospira sp.]
MTELGQIERPAAESFAGKRKLYCVPNIYPIENAPEDYKELFHRYWDEVDKYLERLEIAGKIKKIFCEIIYDEGEKALDVLARINDRALQLIKKKMEEGSTIFPLENKEIFGVYIDWTNCLRIVATKEVFRKVLEFYTEISNKRFEHILDVIQNNLSEAEAGLLIMKDDERARLQFPKDIEVFLVTPPSYDEVFRWIREKLREV